MKQLVFFLEEPSAREMLKGLLPRLFPDMGEPVFVVFEGKQDLEKRLPRRLKAWLQPGCAFVVLRDQDSGDCVEIKKRLVSLCHQAGQPGALVRIACRELESFYLGDLETVAAAIGPSSVARLSGKARYQDPDRLTNAAQELKRIAPGYQKLSGSRAMGPQMRLEGNRSRSFNALISGLNTLIGVAA